MKAIKFACLGAGFLLAGCSFNDTAGYVEPPFGDAVAYNSNLHLAYGNVEQRLRDLSVAFRAAAPDTVTFDFDSSRLTSEARRALDQQAAWLMANEGVRMAIIGHADAPGGERYNNRLGLRRARTVLGYLVAKGVARDRLDALQSRGESEPVVATQERERRNRRSVTAVAGFDFVFVGDGLDGEYALRTYDLYQAGGLTAEETDAGTGG